MRTILIVDDCEEVREITSLLLEHAGYRTVSCDNYSEAIKLCQEEQIDLVLCDLVIPARSDIPQESLSVGIKTIIDFSRKFPAMKIVAMSGAVHNSILNQAEKFGADSVVGKPFSRADLMTSIEVALH